MKRFVVILFETRCNFKNVMLMTSSLIRVHGSCGGASVDKHGLNIVTIS
jgi:hypothetical protein